MTESLKEILPSSAMMPDIQGTTREQILTQMSRHTVALGWLKESEELANTLMERESLGSTGIGQGVAIPHGRLKNLDNIHLIFARSQEAIPFDAIDGNPVRLFFLIVSPLDDGNDHLLLLARIARLMRNSDIREQLLKAPTVEDLEKVFSAL